MTAAIGPFVDPEQADAKVLICLSEQLPPGYTSDLMQFGGYAGSPVLMIYGSTKKGTRIYQGCVTLGEGSVRCAYGSSWYDTPLGAPDLAVLVTEWLRNRPPDNLTKMALLYDAQF